MYAFQFFYIFLLFHPHLIPSKSTFELFNKIDLIRINSKYISTHMKEIQFQIFFVTS